MTAAAIAALKLDYEAMGGEREIVLLSQQKVRNYVEGPFGRGGPRQRRLTRLKHSEAPPPPFYPSPRTSPTRCHLHLTSLK